MQRKRSTRARRRLYERAANACAINITARPAFGIFLSFSGSSGEPAELLELRLSAVVDVRLQLIFGDRPRARVPTEQRVIVAVRADGFRALMAELVARTRPFFERSRAMGDRVGQELRFELRLTWLGGSSVLDRIERVGGDVFRRRPHHSLLDKARLAWRAWRWRAAPLPA